MEHLINPRVREIEISGIRKFYNMVADRQNVISLTIGQPDFNTPPHVKEAAIAAIMRRPLGYTHNAGLIELRRAASAYFKKKYNLEYDPEGEIIVTTGSTQALDIALRSILEPDVEVILPAPAYPGYEPIVRMCGAKPVLVDTTSTGFRITPDLISRALTRKTRCIVIPSPANPTGVALKHQELRALAELLRDLDVFVLTDEVYSELTYDMDHHSLAAFPGMRERTIVVNGLSKSHAMTGWRLGFLLAPAAIAQHMLKVHQYSVTCASVVSQYAALEALTKGSDDALLMQQDYYHRLNYVFERLCSLGLNVVKPDGAFYIFPSIRKFRMSSLEFCLRLVEEAGVAVIPGSAFSQYGEGYIRISYACSMDTLKEGLDRLESFISRL